MDEKKPKIEKGSESGITSSVNRYVTVTVEMEGQGEVAMRIRKDSKLQKAVQSYCTHKGLKKELLRFIFDGNKLNENKTPDDLDLQDGDVICVFSNQDGGCR